MQVPGITAKHCIITDNCRSIRGGNEQAFDEAVNRLRAEYEAILEARAEETGNDFHLILSIETPSLKARRESRS